MDPFKKKKVMTTSTCIPEALLYNSKLALLGGTPQASKHVTVFGPDYFLFWRVACN